jgi:hypothetical protein
MNRPGDTTTTFGAKAADAQFTNSEHLATFQSPLVELSTENERPAPLLHQASGRGLSDETAYGSDVRSIERRPAGPRTRSPGRKFVKAEYQVTTIDGRKTPARNVEGRGRFTARVKAGMDATAGRERR